VGGAVPRCARYFIEMPSVHGRRLRQNPTEAEIRLWSKLRLKQIGGHRFRRQVPIGPYIVDFICLARRLVIEVDGGQHAAESDRDDVRTAWLERQGFRVHRFWNNEVLGNTDGGLAVIADHLAAEIPPPRPSPARGEGE
jgi:very-short-patch-repair endonuclease